MMPRVGGSAGRLNYLLRPAKQVERKLLIEGLTKLAEAGYLINEYTYLGLGSPYFADFILFHKYLYIDKMICVEHQAIPKRMAFNRPFSFVRIHMGEVSDLFPELDREQPYLIWLDYDYPLVDSVLADVGQLIGLLSRRSILIVSVRAELQLPERDDPEAKKKRDQIAVDTNKTIGRLYGQPVTAADLPPVPLAKMFSKSLQTLLVDHAKRRSLTFQPLFNYRYRDGVQMLSVGGVLDTSDAIDALMKKACISGDCFQLTHDPQEISVPPLTVREKLWLDQNLTSELAATDVGFEIDEELFEHFKRYYRYYPVFHEGIY